MNLITVHCYYYCVLITTKVAVIASIPNIIGGGYNYPVPDPPFQFDEPPSAPLPTPIYVPPAPPFHEDNPPPQEIAPTYLPPSHVYPPPPPTLQDEIPSLPPFDDDSVVIPSLPPPSNQYLPPPSPQPYLTNTAKHAPDVRVLNMSCLNGGYFRTTFRASSSSAATRRQFPVLEAASQQQDCVVGAAPQSSDTYQIGLDGARAMQECGVRSCGTRMCLVLRMATIRGLRLADDPLVTLQCVPQEAVVSHTKHLRLNSNSDRSGSARSIATVAAGGTQRRFDTQVNLLRKSSGSDVFDQLLQQGGAVRLGDELLLRAVVRDGDGWRFSRMGSVIVRSAASQKSVTLVDDDGCRSAAMRTVCPHQPIQVNPLIVQLPFRAFLFQGASPADDLLVSVRMLGCLNARDCSPGRFCDDGGSLQARRVTRDTTAVVRQRRKDNLDRNNDENIINEEGADDNSNDNATIITGDWNTELKFRVLPPDALITDNDDDNAMNSNSYQNPLIVTCLVCILTGLICVIIMLIRSKQKR